MNQQEREAFLAQYDLQEDDRLMVSDTYTSLSLWSASNFLIDKYSTLTFHSVWRMVSGVPTEVEPRQKPDYEGHPLWQFFSCLAVDFKLAHKSRFVAAKARDWVQREIKAGRLK